MIDRLKGLIQNESSEIMQIPIELLEYPQITPFKIYGGTKKQKLITSIESNGILCPLIITPSKNRGRYIVLSGANRVDACIQAKKDTVDCIIRTNLSEDDMMLIIIESNLFNRSIDDMLPSELAFALLYRQKVLKHQGKRTDLISTSGSECRKLNDNVLYDKLQSEYKLKERSIRNYIRLTNLNKELLELVDMKKLTQKIGVDLSYLRESEQNELVDLIRDNIIVTSKVSDILKNLSLNSTNIINIKEAIDCYYNTVVDKKTMPIKLSQNDIRRIVPENDMPKVKDIIIIALTEYYKNKDF